MSPVALCHKLRDQQVFECGAELDSDINQRWDKNAFCSLGSDGEYILHLSSRPFAYTNVGSDLK